MEIAGYAGPAVHDGLVFTAFSDGVLMAYRLDDGSETLGVLGEPALCEGMREITEYGGWRAYVDDFSRRRP